MLFNSYIFIFLPLAFLGYFLLNRIEKYHSLYRVYARYAFYCFFPPYSVLYWYTQFAEGSLEAEIQGEKYIIERLLAYPNVSVFYFIYDFITNLDNYTDYTHYTHEMNDYVTQCFQDGTHQLTEESYEKALNEMILWMSECDFESHLQ